jgi:hypothetical protein
MSFLVYFLVVRKSEAIDLQQNLSTQHGVEAHPQWPVSRLFSGRVAKKNTSLSIGATPLGIVQ